MGTAEGGTDDSTVFQWDNTVISLVRTRPGMTLNDPLHQTPCNKHPQVLKRGNLALKKEKAWYRMLYVFGENKEIKRQN